MQLSETLDERPFFARLRRVQLQLLMRAIGLSYNPSTPASILARNLADSGEMNEEDAKLILTQDAEKKAAAADKANKADRIKELNATKLKNLKIAQERLNRLAASIVPEEVEEAVEAPKPTVVS